MVRSTRFLPSLTVAAAVAATLSTLPAFAQEEDAGLQEVVVTARYREENLQTTPLAITALSVEDLEARNLTNVDNLGQSVPNAFFIQPVANYGPTTTIGLRGINTTDYSYAFEPSVGIYIDDVYQSTLTGSSFELMDLDRVEVLRGPQGTLFGKNSLGGAIRLISKKPMGDDTGSVEVTYGSYDRIDAKAVGDFSLIPDKAFLRVVGVSRRRDGYGKSLDFTCEMIRRGTPQLAGIGDGLAADGTVGAPNGQPDVVAAGSAADNAFSFPMSIDPKEGNGCVNQKLGGSETQAARAMLRLIPSDRLEINFSADYQAQTDQPFAETLLIKRGPAQDAAYDNVVFKKYGIHYITDDRFVTGSPYSNYATWGDVVNSKSYDPDQKIDMWGASGTVDYDVTDKVHAKFIAAYRTYDSNWINDSDLTPFGITQTNNLQQHLQRQAELQVTGLAFDDRLDWTTGLFFFNSRSRSYYTTNFENFVASGLLPNFVADDRYSDENKSAFVHAAWHFTDKLSVSGGLRYSDEDKTTYFDHVGQITVPEPLEFGMSRTDWKVGIDYQWTENLFSYAQVSTGFRSPGSNPRISTIGQLTPIPGEEATNYEIGGKMDLLNRRLRLNGAVFYMDYDPRLFQATGAQCNAASNPDPGTPIFGGVNCPPGTDLAGTRGITPWFFYTSVPAKVKGFELEATAFPIENLSVNYSLGYNETDVDVDRGTGAVAPIGYTDDSVRTQPRVNMSLGLQYGFAIGSYGRLTPRVDAFMQSHRTNGSVALVQTDPTYQIGGYTLLNARLGYAPNEGDWEVALTGTNITDKFYWLQLGAATNAAGAPTDGRAGTAGRPREWAVTFKKNF
jgi:iron complex outermembrane receptor protein